MNRRTIRLILVAGTFCIMAILFTQAYWVQKNYSLKQREFDLKAQIALQRIAEGILKYNQNTSPLIDPVLQLQADYFVVKVNDKIDPALLQGLIQSEFLKEGMKIDVSYIIYDCVAKQQAQGWVSFSQSVLELPRALPAFHYNNYYFGIHFPAKDSFVQAEMKGWLVLTLLLLLIVAFFGYVLFVVFRQKQLSEIQRDFINNMTHEFKTPLSSILLSSRALTEQTLFQQPQRWKSYVAIIESEAHKLSGQVERVLQMAKEDEGRIQLKWEEIDLNKLLSEAVDQLSSVFPDKSFRVYLSWDERNPVIMGDRLHLANAFFNLLDNALKYGSANAEIALVTEQREKGVKVTVRDNGIGIAPEHQKKVFDRFYRVPSGNVHNVKGFGLGLSYVKSIVKAHKGYIEMQSRIHEGTTFTLYFPTV